MVQISFRWKRVDLITDFLQQKKKSHNMGQLFWCFISSLFFVALISSGYAAEEPCTAMDPASSPAAKAALYIEVNEATQQDLNIGGNEYVSTIRLNGVYGAKTPEGIELTFGHYYRMVDPREYFAFESETASPFANKVRLIKPIDRDGPTDSVMDDTLADTFSLKCVPFKNKTITYWYTVYLLVKDVNDNSPQLSAENVYSAEINELTPVGTILPIKITATDKDAGVNRQLTYKFKEPVDSMVAEHLMINNDTGTITIKKMFDFESMKTNNNLFQVPIIIHDNEKSVQLLASVMLNLTVIDGDDQMPEFDLPACQRAFGGKCFTPTYNADVENVQQNIPIYFKSSGGGPAMQIKAKDGDSMAAKIEFKISAVIPSKFKSSFSLNVKTPTAKADNGYYTASLSMVKPVDKSDLVGTVVYITATENTPRGLYSVARILFKWNYSMEEKEAEKSARNYNSETLSLIVVVAILAAIVVFAFCVLICILHRKSSNFKMNGHINEGMSL